MERVDCHVLTLRGSNTEWRDNALKSLEHAPVNLHKCRGVAGDLGTSRRKGYAHGNAEFVTFVDEDDQYEPESHGIELCVKALDDNPNSVCAYTMEYQIFHDLTRKYNPASLHEFAIGKPREIEMMHHLVVYRREHVKYALGRYWPDNFMRLFAWPHVEFIPVYAYGWRRHLAQHSEHVLRSPAGYDEYKLYGSLRKALYGVG